MNPDIYSYEYLSAQSAREGEANRRAAIKAQSRASQPRRKDTKRISGKGNRK